jgi:hypothetical protein
MHIGLNVECARGGEVLLGAARLTVAAVGGEPAFDVKPVAKEQAAGMRGALIESVVVGMVKTPVPCTLTSFRFTVCAVATEIDNSITQSPPTNI